MKTRVLVAHARGEELRAEVLAGPLQDAGFEVAYEKTILVGDSYAEQTSRALADGGPVVLCGTSSAIGSRWARTVVNAARRNASCKVFCVRMEEDADAEFLAFDERVAEYWRDPERALEELVSAIKRAYPDDEQGARAAREHAAEARYRRLALESCDIIDLANLPESERHIATRRLELRRLYVPLSVIPEESDDLRVEGSSEAAYSSAQWAAEQQRVSLGTRLVESRRLVVLGEPGAGKTTLLRWIATAYLLRLKHDPDWRQIPAVETLPDEDWLPVIIRCRDLDESCASGVLDDILANTFRKAELDASESTALQELLRGRLKEGRALLLIDGLDEITDLRLRNQFARQLERIHIALPRAPIVVTSRVVGYREMGYRIGLGFEHVTVAEFAGDEKDDFARRWCELTEIPERRIAATRELISDIHSTDRVERLTGNPMLLTTLALVKRKVGRLPSRRTDLYWEALHVLLYWRPEVGDLLDPHEALPQLEYLAYEMCDRGIQKIPKDELITLLERMRLEYDRKHDVQRRSASEFLQLLERRTGILVESGRVRRRGRMSPVYEFRHLTFQEYLAGLALADGVYPNRTVSEPLPQAVGRIVGRIISDTTQLQTAENWIEAVRLSIASAKYEEVDAAIQAVLTPVKEESRSHARQSRIVWAALCLTDEPEISTSTANEVFRGFAEVTDDQNIPTMFSLAVALYTTRWKDLLEAALVHEFRVGSVSRRDILGRLLGSLFTHEVIAAQGAKRKLVRIRIRELKRQESRVIGYFFAAKTHALLRERLLIPAVVRVALWALRREPHYAYAALFFLVHAADSDLDSISKTSVLDHLHRVWEDEGVRELAIIFIRLVGIQEAIPILFDEIDSPNARIRREALGAIASLQGDRIDRKLVSEELDGYHPFIDPSKPITLARIRHASEELEISEVAVYDRYLWLYQKVGIALAADVDGIEDTEW